MHPRTPHAGVDRGDEAQAADVLALHPRARADASARRSRRTSRTADASTPGAARALATTHLLDGMHYRGLLRVAAARQRHAHLRRGRASAGRRHAARRARARATALLDLVVRKYAPLPGSSFVYLARLLRLRRAASATGETARGAGAAREHLASVSVDGVDWYWPADENPRSRRGTRPTSACVCSRRSIRSSGTGAASSCSGAGPIASRPTRRRRSASSATTRCRCCWRDRGDRLGERIGKQRPAGHRISLRRIGTDRSSISRRAEERARAPGRIPGPVAARPPRSAATGGGQSPAGPSTALRHGRRRRRPRPGRLP